MRTKELLEDLLEQHSTEWIVQAFGVCVEANKRTIKYAKGILNNWKTEGGMRLGGREDGKSSTNGEEVNVGLLQEICERLTNHKFRKHIATSENIEPTEYHYRCKICRLRFWNYKRPGKEG